MIVYLAPGTGKYKYYAIVGDRRIGFGAAGYSDYTKHGDIDRKARYIKRHEPREDWENPYTAGFWARWLLWNKKTIAASIRDIGERFGIQIVQTG